MVANRNDRSVVLPMTLSDPQHGFQGKSNISKTVNLSNGSTSNDLG